MYKSDVSEALAQVALVPGGPIERLLETAVVAEPKLYSACAEVATNNDSDLRRGCAHLHEAIGPIAELLAGVSPSMVAIELHQLGGRFDSVLRNHPPLEGLLRPGRQALSELAGAFDLFLQKDKRPPYFVGLIAPSVSLATCYAHYSALQHLFAVAEAKNDDSDSVASIELDGAEALDAFARYVALLSYLADTASSVVEDSEVSEPDASPISIVSIESGSPIRISLTGNGKALRMMLAMLRDVGRLSYLNFTAHGRAIQAMETFARAKELGVDSPVVLGQLEDAMAKATGTYSQSIQGDGVVLTVNGQVVQQDNGDIALPANQQKLLGPAQKSNEGE